MSAPVRSPGGKIIAAVSVSGPLERLPAAGDDGPDEFRGQRVVVVGGGAGVVAAGAVEFYRGAAPAAVRAEFQAEGHRAQTVADPCACSRSDRQLGVRATGNRGPGAMNGAFVEEGGDERYATRDGVICGLAWDESVATFTDRSGNDSYRAGFFSLGASTLATL